jgi:hypothetical protein
LPANTAVIARGVNTAVSAKAANTAVIAKAVNTTVIAEAQCEFSLFFPEKGDPSLPGKEFLAP